jgi:3-oxoacyl-[acyl-carrier protein] reductase
MSNNPDFSFTVGQVAKETVEITEDLVTSFAEFSGDYNPLHVDRKFAEKTSFRQKVAHGMSYGALFSKIIGMFLPGPGALWASQNFRFEKPAFIGDTLTLTVEVIAVSQSTRKIELKCTAQNQNGELILTGTGEALLLETEDEAPVDDRRKDKIALVIGGSKGIGAAIVTKLVSEDYRVAFTYNSSHSEAAALADELDDCIAIQADASKVDTSSGAIGKIITRFGTAPDTLIFCASGSGIYGEAAGSSFDQFSSHLAVQLEATHAIVSRCLEQMIANKHGVITAIGSSFATGVPPAGMAPYVVAKSALAAYIKCLAVEYGPMGIRANLVAPSMTDTGLISRVPDRQRKVMAAQNPLRRLGDPDDVANAVSYLVSDAAAYVNGHTLLLTGGSTM